MKVAFGAFEINKINCFFWGNFMKGYRVYLGKIIKLKKNISNYTTLSPMLHIESQLAKTLYFFSVKIYFKIP